LCNTSLQCKHPYWTAPYNSLLLGTDKGTALFSSIPTEYTSILRFEIVFQTLNILSDLLCNVNMSFCKNGVAFKQQELIQYLASITLFAILLFLLCKIVNGKFPRVGKNPWIHGLATARNDFMRNGKTLTEEEYKKVKRSRTSITSPVLI